MNPPVSGPAIDTQIVYDERGLVPCVIQDWHSGEVLTMAYVNEQALERTRATGELHLWSRSRDELWRKGETSGNIQTVKALRLDCDGDTLLALGRPREALAPLREAVALRQSFLWEGSWELAEGRARLGEALAALGDPDGRRLLETAATALQAELGATHPQTLRVVRSLRALAPQAAVHS